MFDFGDVLSATQTFITTALGLIDVSTMIGGAIAVAIGSSLVIGVAGRLLRLSRRAR